MTQTHASHEPESAIVATRVPEHRRMKFLPKYLGSNLLDMSHRESSLYTLMAQLSSDYTGGMWHFYELSNGAFYMAPDYSQPMQMDVQGNGFSGRMSPDAAGIVATLFALSAFAMRTIDTPEGDRFADHYHGLRDFVLAHPERGLILNAID